MAKGSVRKKGKKWYYRFYVEDASGKMVQKEYAGTESKSETEKLLRKALEDYENKKFVAKADSLTVGELLDMWAEEELKTGTLSNGTVDIGSYVGGSLQPVTLATIYKDDQMYAYFNVADNQWLEMSMNNQQPTKDLPKKIMVQLGKEGTESYPATLDYLSPNVDLNTGTLMVRANFDNPQGVLKSGLYVSITLPYGEADHAILVKEASIGTDQLGKFLYAVNDSDIVHYRHIEIGQLINDTLRQVLGGLSPQERYVTEALMKVRDGMKIKPIP